MSVYIYTRNAKGPSRIHPAMHSAEASLRKVAVGRFRRKLLQDRLS